MIVEYTEMGQSHETLLWKHKNCDEVCGGMGSRFDIYVATPHSFKLHSLF